MNFEKLHKKTKRIFGQKSDCKYYIENSIDVKQYRIISIVVDYRCRLDVNITVDLSKTIFISERIITNEKESGIHGQKIYVFRQKQKIPGKQKP